MADVNHDSFRTLWRSIRGLTMNVFSCRVTRFTLQADGKEEGRKIGGREGFECPELTKASRQ